MISVLANCYWCSSSASSFWGRNGGAHNIGLFRFVSAKRHGGRFEVGFAHIYADQIIIGDGQNHPPVGGADADIALIGQPFQTHKTGKAARTIAALRHFTAISIENAIVKIQFRLGALGDRMLILVNIEKLLNSEEMALLDSAASEVA